MSEMAIAFGKEEVTSAMRRPWEGDDNLRASGVGVDIYRGIGSRVVASENTEHLNSNPYFPT